MRFYWRSRADTQPESWRLLHAVIVDGAVVGACDLFASDFPTLRQFETGSWLGREFQGRGLGKEMRLAALTLGFDGLGAEFATTGLWHDNAASLGVTQSLGYEQAGRRGHCRRGRSRRADSPSACPATTGTPFDATTSRSTASTRRGSSSGSDLGLPARDVWRPPGSDLGLTPGPGESGTRRGVTSMPIAGTSSAETLGHETRGQTSRVSGGGASAWWSGVVDGAVGESEGEFAVGSELDGPAVVVDFGVVFRCRWGSSCRDLSCRRVATR